jgi:hypothetical protein
MAKEILSGRSQHRRSAAVLAASGWQFALLAPFALWISEFRFNPVF